MFCCLHPTSFIVLNSSADPIKNCTAFHCTKLQCSAYHYTAMHCITLHCTSLWMKRAWTGGPTQLSNKGKSCDGRQGQSLHLWAKSAIRIRFRLALSFFSIAILVSGGLGCFCDLVSWYRQFSDYCTLCSAIQCWYTVSLMNHLPSKHLVVLLDDATLIISTPGQSQGLLSTHLRHWLINWLTE